jgi:RNA polymerase sigma factor (sigma-70 family)
MNAALYTPRVQAAIRRVAVNLSRKTGGAVDADELFSAGESEIGMKLAEYTVEKCRSFEGWACQYARWAMQHYLRDIDAVPIRLRRKGERGSNLIHADAQHAGFLELIGGAVGPERGEQADDIRRLRECLARLDARSVRVLVAIYIEGKSGVQVASELKCTDANISIIKIRALRKLRRFFERLPQPHVTPAGTIPPLREIAVRIRPEQTTARQPSP